MSSDLELAIRAHARAMYEWGQCDGDAEEARVKREWKFLKSLIDKVQKNILLEVLLYGDASTTHINVTDKLEELGIDKSQWKEV